MEVEELTSLTSTAHLVPNYEVIAGNVGILSLVMVHLCLGVMAPFQTIFLVDISENRRLVDGANLQAYLKQLDYRSFGNMIVDN
jgi:hypothetical protein